jgi:UDP-N-acetylmuramyl pentapeptide phosphotransferase/UDP-N-acetylglucosamine-1-phosphate transferase
LNDQLPPERLFPTLDSLESILWPGAALVVFVVTAVLVDVMILLATRLQLVDVPSNRSAHALPTARGGGMPLVLTCCLASVAVCLRWPAYAFPVAMGIIIPSSMIAVVGFWDDIRPLRATLRLFVQIGVSVLIVAVLGPVERLEVPGIGGLGFGWLAWPLSILWVVGWINAYNFMDGSDGMAALGAVAVAAGFVAITFWIGDFPTVLLASFAGAAAAGFLVYNWSPARVFMGDVGSAFLGAFFAAVTLLDASGASDRTFLPMAMAAWPYIYDPLLSVIRRVWTGHNPLIPHREFLFHRLVRSGVSHATVAVLYAFLAGIGALAGWLMVTETLTPEVRRLLPLTVPVLAALLTAATDWRFRRVMSASGKATAAVAGMVSGSAA